MKKANVTTLVAGSGPAKTQNKAAKKNATKGKAALAQAKTATPKPEAGADQRNADGIGMTPARVEELAAKKAGVKTEAQPKAAKKPHKTSGLDAAAQVLGEVGKPMTCRQIVEKMLADGLWKTNGKTPHATIYSAMLREIDDKPGESRFEKTGRGLFALAQKKAS